MQIQNIQSTQNFQGKAILIKNYSNPFQNRQLNNIIGQLNSMNIIKNNKFDIFVEGTMWNNARITAAKNAKAIRRYEEQKVTSMTTTLHPETIIGTSKLVSYKHRYKLASIKEEQSKTFWGKIKNLFT